MERPPLRIQLTVSNLGTPDNATVTAKVVSDGPERLDYRELHKAHFTEAMNGYRFFGTLRAQIAWAPAIIAVAVMTHLATRTKIFDHDLAQFAIPVFLILISAAIYPANHYLPLKQRNSGNVAKKAEHLLKNLNHHHCGLSFL